MFPVNDLDAEATLLPRRRPGIPGVETAGDKFGNALAFVSGAAERAWIIGVPDDVDHATGWST